ncbi:hypothetical protein JYT16_00850 [Gemmatimonas aurantiaca]|nr:hypothetical protein [Gemmatimonas aurantiaca]
MFEFSQIEISQTQLLATALNAVGFLAASALSALVYVSLFNRRLRKLASMSEISGQITASVVDERHNVAVQPREQSPIRDNVSGSGFVVIDSSSRSSYAKGQGVASTAMDQNGDTRWSTNSENANSGDHGYGRNRAEVIRLAREMLKAGNSAERVTDLLPVSESEMQLIRMSSGNSA